jgi:hypothetical protein
MKHLRIFRLILIALIAAGCNMPTPVSAPATEEKPATGAVLETTLTPAPQVIPTVAPQVCPIPPGSTNLPGLDNPSTWAAGIHAYLNAGGLINPLLDYVQAGYAYDPSAKVGEIIDLNNDGFEDLAIVLVQSPTESALLPTGSLLIFLCAGDSFQTAYVSAPASEGERPELYAVQDFNGDGLPELLVLWNSCGAHTCFTQAELLKWAGAGFENLWLGRSDDLPSPVIELQGPDADGQTAITIRATGIGSAGAGPYREIRRTWTWRGESGRFEIFEETLSEPYFRIHALHDADQAALEGDYETAVQGYSRVMEDGSLDDWISGEEGRAALGAYAAYRQVVLYALLDNLTDAEAGVLFLQAAHPPSSPYHAYAEMAEGFWETFLFSGDIGEACLNAQSFALSNSDAVLLPLYYGYANRSYLAADLCPFDT